MHFLLWELSMAVDVSHRHRVCLVDRVDLICSLCSWWEGFGSSPLAALPLGFNCGFISTSACGLSTGVCSWDRPGGLGFAPVRVRWGGGAAAWVTGVLAAPGTQGSWRLWQQEIYALERYDHQYCPICCSILAWRTRLPDREALKATVYRVTKSRTLPKQPCMHRRKTCWPVAALPQWELSVKVAQLLGLWGPWLCQVCRDTDCLLHRSHGPISLSEPLSGDQNPSLASLSLALPVQALRGLPCLGSFSVVGCKRHTEGAPLAGVLCCRSACQALKRGAPGGLLLCSSVPQAFGGPASLLFSCQCWRVGGEKLWWWLYPLRVTQQERLASMAAWLSSTGISQQSPPSHPLKLPLPVNSGPRPGVAAQSLNSSSQLLCLAGPNQRHDSSEANLKKGPKWKVAQFLELSTSSTK